MASLNKVILIGHLGQDPEVRHTTNGDPVCNLNVATSESWKDKATGEKRESTEWHRVVMFGKSAEVAEKYLRKGSQIYIEGKIVSRKYKDKDGIDRVSFNIQSESFQMFNKPQSNTQSNNDAPKPQTKQVAKILDDYNDPIPF